VDGQSATGTDNRDKILKAYANGRAKALLAEDFLALATSKKGAELSKDHDLIVIYHNRIDRIGDKRESEAETPVPYKIVELKLQRPLGSDFDDL
jgi:hypothetical protein